LPDSTHTISALLALSAVEYAAGAVLAVAVASLALAVRSAARHPGGLTRVFGFEDRSSREIGSAADELRTLVAEARAASDELAASFDERAAGMARLISEAEEVALRLERIVRESRSARSPNAAHDLEPKPVPRPVAAGMGGDPMAGEIYRLADAGLPPVEIAGRLGQHTGKVELILALRRGGRAAMDASGPADATE